MQIELKRIGAFLTFFVMLFSLLKTGCDWEACKDWINAQKEIPYSLDETATEKWEAAVSAIEARYQGEIPQGRILFYGSSSIRKWTTMQTDLAPLEVLNHGFGGSSLDDAIYYADRLVFPFAPKAVVIYCGVNDFGNSDPERRKTADRAYAATVELLSRLREQLPDTKLYYISISPNECFWKYWDEMKTCNLYVRLYCEAHRNMTFIDTSSVLLDENGKYRRELFGQDGLHFNENGYAAWTSVIRPILMEDFGAQEVGVFPQESTSALDNYGILC